MLRFRAGFNSFRQKIPHTLERLGVAVHQIARGISAMRIAAFDRLSDPSGPAARYAAIAAAVVLGIALATSRFDHACIGNLASSLSSVIG
jgi:hypothetical protein